MKISKSIIKKATANLGSKSIFIITSREFDTLVYDVFGVPFIMQNEKARDGEVLDSGDALIIDLTHGLVACERADGDDAFIKWLEKKGEYKMYGDAWRKIAELAPENRYMADRFIQEGVMFPSKFVIEVS